MQATFSTTMTCGGCLSKVKPYLDDNADIKSWEADLQDPRKLLRFELAENAQPDAIASLIGQAGFTATQINETSKSTDFQEESATKPRFEFSTYKPLFLVVSYVIGAAALFELSHPSWELSRFMNNFMGFFFLGFAFFKLLNIAKFADAFATYDIVADAPGPMRWPTLGLNCRSDCCLSPGRYRCLLTSSPPSSCRWD